MIQRRYISGRESIWEYPRAPVVQPAYRHIRVIHADTTIAVTSRARRVCEMGHAPTYYVPPEDVRLELLEPNDHTTYSEWKGIAVYFDLHVGDEVVENAAWYYPETNRRFQDIRDFVSFFPHCVDQCLVDGHAAVAEPDEFYGGWVTPDIEGPFR